MQKFALIVFYASLIAFMLVTSTMLMSCTTTKIGWGSGDGMNKQCKNNYASHRSPFNFN